MSFLPLLFAPWTYFLVGLPWAILARRPWLAPGLGLGVAGLSAEYAYLTHLPAGPVVLAVAGAHCAWVVAWALRNRGPFSTVGREMLGFGLLYLVALVPMLCTAFPTPGGWGGDWMIALESGQTVYAGIDLRPVSLSRPPLLGAATSLCWSLGGMNLPAFQAVCAVASACALRCVVAAIPTSARRALPLVAGSVFFLQITANTWPKFMAAAYIVSAWQVLRESTARRDYVTSAILAGLAIAAHQSSVLFVPLLLVRVAPRWRDRERVGLNLLEVAGYLFIAALICTPWELFTVGHYGLQAKLNANPVVNQRLENIPPWLNAMLVGVTTFVGWEPVSRSVALIRRLSTDRGASLGSGYWLVISYLNTMAGTLLGLVLPATIALGVRRAVALLGQTWRETDAAVKLALAFALAGQMVLNPYFSSEGSAQSGWVPAGLLIAIALARAVDAAGPRVSERAIRLTCLVATLPWFLFNTGLTLVLRELPSAANRFFDSDLMHLRQLGFSTIALDSFPWGGLLSLVILVGLFYVNLERIVPLFCNGPVGAAETGQGSKPQARTP